MILGIQYYRSPFPEETYWESDLRSIREAGFNTVQFWMTWASAEPSPGKFDFTAYDRLFDLAERNGLNVVLSILPELQPLWILRVVPGSELINARGLPQHPTTRSETHWGLTPGGCFDHPEIARLIRGFLTAAANRYGARPSVVGWDVWNELRWERHADGPVCYCPQTLAAFRQWLKQKYGSLEMLNKSWKRTHDTWEDVQPGRRSGMAYTEMMEWQAFLIDRLTSHGRDRYAAIREFDKVHPIVAHSGAPCLKMGGHPSLFPQYRGNDWDHADVMDAWGFSAYPTTIDELGPWIEMSRSAAGGKPLWACELQGGPLPRLFESPSETGAAQQQRWLWTCIARGVKAVIFWCWRDEVFCGEAGALGFSSDTDGQAAARCEAMRKTASVLREHATEVEAYRPASAKVGVLFETTTAQLEYAASNTPSRVLKAIEGYMHALDRLNTRYDVVDGRHPEPLSRLKMLVMPWPLTVREELKPELIAFVERGGTLLVEADLDAFDALGFYRYPQDRAFAMRVATPLLSKESCQPPDFALTLDGHIFHLRGEGYFTRIVDSEGEVLARTALGSPCAVARVVGNGRVITLGTFAGQPYRDARYEDFERFLEHLVQASGAHSGTRVSGEGDFRWVEGAIGDHPTLFVENRGPAVRLTVQWPAARARTWRDLISDRQYGNARGRRSAGLALDLAEQQCIFLIGQ